MKEKFQFGFDIGSISINTVVLDASGSIISDRYDYCHGKPFEKLKEILDDLEKVYSKDQFAHLSFTGTAGKLAAELFNGSYVNEIVAQSTIKIFKRSVPAAVPGIAFLSGGQSSKLATVHLNAMNKDKNLPWELSFSYGRALQEDCLAAWKGERANKGLAQKVLLHRAKCNGAARFGKYSSEVENQ